VAVASCLGHASGSWSQQQEQRQQQQLHPQGLPHFLLLQVLVLPLLVALPQVSLLLLALP
jgi:hypothetical protein